MCSKQISIEDELIVLRLTEGMFGISYKRKIPERLQAHNRNLEACVDFLQQLELIQEFNAFESSIVLQCCKKLNCMETLQQGTGKEQMVS